MPFDRNEGADPATKSRDGIWESDPDFSILTWIFRGVRISLAITLRKNKAEQGRKVSGSNN
jgi:hypothetical protein